MSLDSDKLKAMFEEEAREHLENLEADLLALEKTPGNADLVNRILRAMHSIKGGAGFAGYEALSQLSHAGESVMVSIRDDSLAASPAVIDALLTVADRLQKMVDDLDNSESLAIDDCVAALDALKGGGDVPPAPIMPTPAEDVVVEEIPEDTEDDTMAHSTTDETVRVPVRVLDNLMTLAGEMVLGRNQLLRVTEEVAETVDGLPGVLQNISNVTSELQEHVMRTRMQPIRGLFTKFERITRDLAKELQKEIRMETSGMEVELDKSLMELLVNPLLHLVRNCADHAIEKPDERERLGKPRMGTISLSARHEGGQVHIEVLDDGKGIDAGNVRQKAVERGLIGHRAADDLSDRQALSYIFKPGFSTADKVTQYSGRGVGMDVVRANVAQFGGSIDVDSEPGRGTRITLSVPLTLAIIPSMVITLDDRQFAVPTGDLEEIVRLSDENRIEKAQGLDMLRLRDKLLPIIDLRELLQIDTDAASRPERPFVLVLQTDRHRFGLVVDALLDTREIVVKPLSRYLRSSRCYSGAAVLGDGSLVLILDTTGIADAAGLRAFDIVEEQMFKEETKTSLASADQPLLLFRNGTSELFALNLELVRCIERVSVDKIERVGNKEFVTGEDGSMRILRIHDYCSVTRPETDPEVLHIIVPRIVRHPIGIVATEVVDIARSHVGIEQENLAEPGIFGTTVIDEKLVVLVDVYGLYEKAEPQLYGTARPRGDLAAKRILLAEHGDIFRTMEREYLRSLGCDVRVVKDGKAAWEQLESENYDLVLTDLDTPGTDGAELTRRIKSSERHRQMPVVALTSALQHDLLARTQNIDVDACENRLDKEHLLDTLERILATRNEMINPQPGEQDHV